MIPYGRQEVTEADIQAVVDVLRSDFLTQGPIVPRFEEAVAAYCGAKYAVAVNSATSALHIACLALDVGQGDVVWTSAITFVASANCALFCGASVDFVDIDPHSYNMSVECLARKLARAEQTHRLPKVVIPVHLCGRPCDMAAIHALSQRYGFGIIEDASHAIGGKYQGAPIGNCRYSDVTVFSFHPVKSITAGEGGMALTHSEHLAKRMQRLRSHGITRDNTEMKNEPEGLWYYEQVDLGFNYRMSDLHAALGLSQLRRLDALIARRHAIAARYDKLLAPLPIVTPAKSADGYSGLHLYVIRLSLAGTRTTHGAVFAALRAASIGVALHYMPVYRHPYYAQLGFEPDHCPAGEQYYTQALTLPMYPGLTDDQQDQVVGALREILTTQ